jgi:glycosyltransferase involved in cell wall biosynthesis
LLTSFIVPAHNEEQLLPATLASIVDAARSLGLAFEVIVVDDASTDRTAEIARAHGAQVCSVSLRQISAVRNAGARTSAGGRLFFVDADTVVTPEVIDAAIRALDAGAIGGGAVVRFDQPVPLWARVVARFTVWTMRLTKFAAGCFIFCTREAFDAAGGFDETLFASEEIWFSRALKRQGRFVILDTSVTTSSRKAHMYSGLEVLRMTWPLFYRGLDALRDRRHLDLWYGKRR